MSQCTIDWVMSRIKVATDQSPVAVFKMPGSTTMFNVVFESTVITKSRINHGDDLLIGIFHQNMSTEWVREQILCSK